jgi:hypothetical protein
VNEKLKGGFQMKTMKKTVLVLLLLGMAGAVGFSYSYDCWTGMTGDGVIAINPFVYLPAFDPVTLGTDLVAAYGFSPSVDLFVNFASLGFLPEFTYGGSWAMLRLDLGGSNILALQAGTAFVSPQYHLFLENEIFAFEANVYAKFMYEDITHPTFGAYLAPVLKLSSFAFYCEVDPAYALDGVFSLFIMPGAYVNMGQAGQLSVGVGLGDVLTALTPGVYVSYLFLMPTKPAVK